MPIKEFDANKYEHDYVVGILENFAEEIKLPGASAITIDKYAVQLTAFMQGEITAFLKSRFAE